MGEKSKIEWCDHTFNPWIGCTKVSPGCVNCYAEGESKRRGWAQWGKGKERHRTSASYWKQPLKWNREGGRFSCDLNDFRRPRVFCASLADWLDDEVPIEWLADLLALIHETPNLDWLLLTKRPENWETRLEAAFQLTRMEFIDRWLTDDDFVPANVWIGTSVEDQKRADERIPALLKIPARIRFLSCEPLLGDIYCRHHAFAVDGVHWVIIGGESGLNSRECNIEWIRGLVGQCKSDGVPVFVKQLGRNAVRRQSQIQGHLILADRKGGDPSEWPIDLRIREFPKLEVAA